MAASTAAQTMSLDQALAMSATDSWGKTIAARHGETTVEIVERGSYLMGGYRYVLAFDFNRTLEQQGISRETGWLPVINDGTYSFTFVWG